MRVLYFFLALVCVLPALGMTVVEPVVVSVAGLREKGLTLELHGKRPDAVSVSIPRDNGDERFIRLELVVVAQEVSQASVASDYSGGRPVRRAVSEARKGTFDLFRREARRAYLAIHYQCPLLPRGVPHERVYLIALSELPGAAEN
jgi:hypothetical protein